MRALKKDRRRTVRPARAAAIAGALTAALVAVSAPGCPRRSATPVREAAPPENLPRTRPPPDGPHLRWWSRKAGRKKVEGAYAKGHRHGRWTWWFRSGGKRREASFVHGRYHGPFTAWHPNGRIRRQGRYHRGRRIGEWKRFHPSGSIAERCQYRDDVARKCTRTFEFDSDVIDSDCPPIPPRRRAHPARR